MHAHALAIRTRVGTKDTSSRKCDARMSVCVFGYAIEHPELPAHWRTCATDAAANMKYVVDGHAQVLLGFKIVREMQKKLRVLDHFMSCIHAFVQHKHVGPELERFVLHTSEIMSTNFSHGR